MRTELHNEFLALYEPIHDAFARYCAAIAYGKVEVDDLIQDCLAVAWANFRQLKDREKLLHYLMKVAKHKVYSFLRKPKFQEEIAENFADRLLAKGANAQTILEVQELYLMLDRLPASQKQAVILFEISGFSMAEIAKIQDSTEGAVKTKISRGRALLKSFYENDQPQEKIQSVFQTLQSIML